MSRVYKSKNLTPKSPVVWNYEPVEIPVTQSDKLSQAEQPGKTHHGSQELPQETLDEIKQDAKDRAEQEAQEIVEKAKQEREDILEQAKSEGYELGYQEGYESGKEQAMQDTQAEREHLLEEAKNVLIASKADYQRLLESAESEISQLIIDIAEKLISDKLSQERELIIELVKNGMRKLTNQDKVVIRAHPEDYAQLEAHRNQLVTEFDEVRLELVRDEELAPGSPLLLGDNGHIDLNVNRQLEELRRTLRQVVDSGNQ